MANIFIIDDEPVLLELISRTLRLDGHSVRTFSNPLSVFDSSANVRPGIDLVLTDVNMKPITGFEVARRLTQAGFTGPVIYMSGYATASGDDIEAFDHHPVIGKPFTCAELRAAVGKALAGCAERAQTA
jgi:two-component system OmpR family response regulator